MLKHIAEPLPTRTVGPGTLEPSDLQTTLRFQCTCGRVSRDLLPCEVCNTGRKLTVKDVLAIRRSAHKETGVALAAKYGVSNAAISKIINRKRWASVTDERDLRAMALRSGEE